MDLTYPKARPMMVIIKSSVDALSLEIAVATNRSSRSSMDHQSNGLDSPEHRGCCAPPNQTKLSILTHLHYNYRLTLIAAAIERGNGQSWGCFSFVAIISLFSVPYILQHGSINPVICHRKKVKDNIVSIALRTAVEFASPHHLSCTIYSGLPMGTFVAFHRDQGRHVASELGMWTRSFSGSALRIKSHHPEWPA